MKFSDTLSLKEELELVKKSSEQQISWILLLFQVVLECTLNISEEVGCGKSHILLICVLSPFEWNTFTEKLVSGKEPSNENYFCSS